MRHRVSRCASLADIGVEGRVELARGGWEGGGWGDPALSFAATDAQLWCAAPGHLCASSAATDDMYKGHTTV
jgi:hypothetical protein